MKKLLLAALLITNFIIISPQTSFACSCMLPASPQESLTQHDVVFTGTVSNIITPGQILSDNHEPLAVTFDVSQKWKGPDHSEITIYTQQDSAACGFPFEQGKEYIVYANYNDTDGETLHTGLCTRTSLLSDASNDIEELNEMEITTETPLTPSTPKPISENLTSQNNYTSVITVGSVILLVIIAMSISLRK